MKEENYKAIAKIIKKCSETFNHLGLVAELANYFEKEEKGLITANSGLPITPKFNKKQFLKECGIENDN